MDQLFERLQLLLQPVEVMLGSNDVLTAAAAEEWPAHGAFFGLFCVMYGVVGLDIMLYRHAVINVLFSLYCPVVWCF
jgi:hypothetical protein